jgi:hypothetical protein
VKFLSPDPNDEFTVSSAPTWPHVVFQTDASGPHSWKWTIAWAGFTKSGTEATSGDTWDATQAIANRGGTLTVAVTAGDSTTSIAVKIKGTNPDATAVTQYLASKPASTGFDKIIRQEANFKHFNETGQPIKSFDNGYGMCQLTEPAPTFEQVWNWKMNVDAGLMLFAQKRSAAKTYLSQGGRTFDDNQLTPESVCRWNGGHYHEWDAVAKKWVRPTNLLCDRKTGNIGWDLNDAQNKGKTEQELHKRDSTSYSKPPAPDAHWKFLGVCYADHVLG